MTQDEKGYKYAYDYENRIIEVRNSANSLKAEYVYDALGRRIQKNDVAAGKKTRYYYNDKWQVTCQYDIIGVTESFDRCFVYGNYIDEALLMKTPSQTYYYGHDRLYSPVILVNAAGTAQERYEYDAYGSARIYDGTFSSTRSQPLASIGNPYLFTGREVDYLDNGSRPLQYNRHRYYLQGIGRWTSEDPLGIDPAGGSTSNLFAPCAQCRDSLSLFAYASDNPVREADPSGLVAWLYANKGITGHAGIIVEGDDIDFGPAGLNVLWTKGECPWSGGGIGVEGTNPWEEGMHKPVPYTKWVLHLKKWGSMMLDGQRIDCKCASMAQAQACIYEQCSSWNGSTYAGVGRNCQHFAQSAKNACCLHIKKGAGIHFYP